MTAHPIRPATSGTGKPPLAEELLAEKAEPGASETMEQFDYAAPAEIFLRRGAAKGWAPLTYRRFATASDAICFATDELPPKYRASVVMEVLEKRFDHRAIQRLRAGAALSK